MARWKVTTKVHSTSANDSDRSEYSLRIGYDKEPTHSYEKGNTLKSTKAGKAEGAHCIAEGGVGR